MLCALLIGGVYGGAAGAIGMTIADLTDPAYISSAPKTFVLKFIIGLVAGIGAYTMGDKLLAIYDSDPEVIGYGLTRMSLVCAPYFLCGMMDVMVGSLRGMGYSIMPMIVSLTGACLFRVIWILTVFAANHTLFTLYISYPISCARLNFI